VDNDGLLPPVDLLGELAPVDHPQYIPGHPHNLPPRRDRPAQRGYLGLSGADLIGGLGDGASILPPGTSTTGPAPAVDPTAVSDPWHQALITEGQATVGVASIKIIDQPSTKRNYLMIRNNSATAVIFVSFGRDASTISPVRLSSNQMMLLDVVVPQDDVYCLSDTAATSVVYAFSTTP
jgi:hypothetical protein